ncbi:four helix bundle protein [Roseimaritima sediminicola]|uniref:four helix bundle protein n=1 Tax=Roseimaritima sediminicola TaxID=2662066 RepID=UPI00129831BE|nr:four helix bundle protein [Roseimaritima sediminicola]
MTEPIFDHDRLDVYRLSIEYVSAAFDVSKSLSGLHRHARDQWLRAAQSIPLNIAEGNGKRSLKDRARFFDIARGSAFECAAIKDVLVASGGLDYAYSREMKLKLKRIVSMLTRMAMKFDGVGESAVDYAVAIDYEHEHRDAEHEHEREPEPSRAPEDGLRGFANGKSIVRPR